LQAIMLGPCWVNEIAVLLRFCDWPIRKESIVYYATIGPSQSHNNITTSL